MCWSVLRKEFHLVQFRLLHPNSADFAESPWFGVLIVLLYRCTIAAFCAGSIIWSAVYRSEVEWLMLIYLTNWSFFMVTLYFICSAIISAIHFKTRCQQRRNTVHRDPSGGENNFEMAGVEESKETSAGTCKPRDTLVTSPLDDSIEIVDNNDAPEASRDTPMNRFHEAVWVIYNIASTAALMVTITFWTFYRGSSPLSVVFHAVNSVVIVCDTMLSSVPVRLFHVVYPMLYFVAYIMFTVIYWACCGAIYSLTDYTVYPVYSTVSVVCLFFIVVPLCQCLLFCLYRLRVWIKTKCIAV